MDKACESAGVQGWMEMLYRIKTFATCFTCNASPAEFGLLLIIVLYGTNIHIVFM